MSNYMTKYSAEDILNELNEKEFITDDKFEQLSEFIISKQSEQELPLYLRVLLGIGAFNALGFIIGFLVLAGILTYDSINCIISGLIFIGGAIGLRILSNQKRANFVANSFLMQFSFTSMLIGKILFVVGLTWLLESPWAVTLALLLISGATYHIYKVSVDRFLSSFALLSSILVTIVINWDNLEPLINGLFIFQFIGSAALLTYPKIKRDYIPLSYAFVFSLCATVFHLTCYSIIVTNLIFINIVLAAGLIALFILASGGVKKLKKEPLIITSIVALLLGLISAPGILLAIGLLVLGYYKYENILIGLGVLMLAVFLFSYYYNLDISLMQKSIVLIASGVLLLLGRFYIKFKYIKKGNYA